MKVKECGKNRKAPVHVCTIFIIDETVASL
jgi:hypothetical protein